MYGALLFLMVQLHVNNHTSCHFFGLNNSMICEQPHTHHIMSTILIFVNICHITLNENQHCLSPVLHRNPQFEFGFPNAVAATQLTPVYDLV